MAKEIKTEEKNKFCMLCFQYCDSNFEILKYETNKMLELLLFKVDFNIAEKQVICTNCSVSMEVSFKFKTSCLNTENYIKSLMNSEVDSKVNLSEIYVNGIDNKDTVNLSEGCAVCRLCMKLVQNGCWVPLNGEISNEMLKMLKQWLPDLDLNITEDPVMCMSCKASLEDYFDFIKKCPGIKENCYGFKEKCDLDQDESKLTSHFKLENYFLYEDCGTEYKYQEGGNTDEIILNNDIVKDTDIREMDIEQTEIDIKSENGNFSGDDETITPVNENAAISKSKDSLFNCELCTYSTNNRTKLKKHTIFHQDISTAVMFNCQVCPFMTKYRSNLREHMKIHSDDVTIYQCEVCKYETKSKAYFKRHSQIHRRNLEVTLYHCEVCKFKTKYKTYLKRHTLIHNSYSCDICSYKSNTQHDIDLHNLVHNGAVPKPKGVMYSCEACPYKTKHKSTFNTHLITHLDPSDSNIYECKSCGFKTKHKYYLGKHMSSHERLKYQCEDCDFKTNHKKDFEKHSLLHLPANKTKMFHCPDCKFITKYKLNLKKHMVLHQKESLIKMYRCDVCDFKTRHKKYVKVHALTHRDRSERKMYVCDMCDYKALYNCSLLRHMYKIHGVGEDK